MDAIPSPSAPRVTPLQPPYSDEVAADLAKLTLPGAEPLHLFRTVAHNARVLRRMRRGGLLDPGAITARERELVIDRTCARCGSTYEWGVHAALFAEICGLDEATLAGTVTRRGDDPAWTADDALLVRLVDELHDTATLSDGLWGALAARWSPAAIVELLALVGFYHAVSFLTNALRIDGEAFARPFPARPSGV